MLSRRHFFLSSAAALVAGRKLVAEAPLPVVTVYKDPTCGCCTKWVKYMSANGFVIMPRDVPDVDKYKAMMHVPKALQSCHTAIVGKYVVEGHVPADVIKKLLSEDADLLGLAVPGMVDGSPGMEGAKSDHYDIVAFDHAGKTRVYAKR
ncbi:MAG TPA: DUF411 domain-containing protein [Gemmatimonadaceae bacterium]|jgi:hypothetical protein